MSPASAVSDPIFFAIVDSFTDRPFAGNPAGVCILPRQASDAWMLGIARETGHSETAFLVARQKEWDLRWFTPEAEVDLCGHATLAAAHFLFEIGRIDSDADAKFHTRSGLLTVRREGAWLSMDFPRDDTQPVSADPEFTQTLAEALGIRILNLALGKFDYLAEAESEALIRSLKPDFSRLAQLSERGVMVTSRADDPAAGYDFVSRFFAPAIGIPEDPVTGSAHCTLAPYWAQRLGKTEMTGYQCSARGGMVRTRLAGERVILGGRAVTIAKGQLAARE